MENVHEVLGWFIFDDEGASHRSGRGLDDGLDGVGVVCTPIL